MRYPLKQARGFTLIEMLVSVAIFAIVMVVALGALLSLAEAARKAQALSVAVNNLSAALDSMSRNIRTGGTYHCGVTGALTVPLAPADCAATSNSYIAFIDADKNTVAYCLDGTTIKRQIVAPSVAPPAGFTNCASSGFIPLTTPDVSITGLGFYVTGSARGVADSRQPKVTILLAGTSVIQANGKTAAFNIQTSVTQRIYDQ